MNNKVLFFSLYPIWKCFFKSEICCSEPLIASGFNFFCIPCSLVPASLSSSPRTGLVTTYRRYMYSSNITGVDCLGSNVHGSGEGKLRLVYTQTANKLQQALGLWWANLSGDTSQNNLFDCFVLFANQPCSHLYHLAATCIFLSRAANKLEGTVSFPTIEGMRYNMYRKFQIKR